MVCNRCGKQMEVIVYPDVFDFHCSNCRITYCEGDPTPEEDYRCFGCGDYDCGGECAHQ